jgi:hypothetical protein
VATAMTAAVKAAEAAHQKPFASVGIEINRGKGVVELDIAGRLADASRAVPAAGLRICGGAGASRSAKTRLGENKRAVVGVSELRVWGGTAI